MKVENPSKTPIVVCRVLHCTVSAPVEAVGGQWKLPSDWKHDVGKGPLCPAHAQNGSGARVINVKAIKTPRPSSFNLTGDTCRECGSVNLVPAGRCMRCMDCGGSTGCG
jgi:hypothetical protein